MKERNPLRMAIYGLLTCCTALLKHQQADQVSDDERADLLARILVVLRVIGVSKKELIEMWDATHSAPHNSGKVV